MKTTSFIFNHFKEFAEFCLSNVLDKICESYFNNIKSLDLPLITLFRDVPEKVLMTFFRERFILFLNDAIADRCLEEILQLTDRWKHGALPYEVNKYSVQPSDLLIGFGIRKDVLLQFLPEFTKDVRTALSIVQELNDYHLHIEELILKLSSDINNDIIRKKNEELQISNELLIREIREKEKAVKIVARERRFKDTLINNVNFGVLSFDRNFRITTWNRLLEEHNNLKKEDVIGRHLFDLFPEYKFSGEEVFFRNVLEGVIINLEDLNRNGKKGFFDAVLIPLKHEEKKITGGICIVNDISERKVLEDRLKNSLSELKEVQEIARLGIFEWNIKTNKLKCSEEILKQFHLNNTGDLTFTSFKSFIDPDDCEILENLIKESVEGNKPFSTEIRIKDKDLFLFIKGKVISIHNRPYKLKGIILDISERRRIEEEIRAKNQALSEKNDELKKAEEALIVINNELEERVEERTFQLSVLNEELQKEVIEREKAEEELKQRNEELLRINDDLDNFVYSASHDLKAPISNIEGLIFTLDAELKTGNGNTTPMIMDLIHRSIANFKDTLQGLTDIAKISDASSEDQAVIAIDQVVDEIKQNIKEMISSCNAEVITDFSNCPNIRFSRTNLKSILYNLLSNAIKYRSPFRTPSVVIKTGCENDYIYFEVSDNGIGFDPSLKNNIFSMFKRLHFHVDGSGIGLYLVKRIVDKNGGRIEVESAPDKGTTFKVYLKAAA
ncbi:PAS domain-containing sensor histidine kinase [Sporocytophaga myxococcoides]|uniref:PAS domain-containing sensor histidine kinase n=1 Tax=Sporocytophaga myxococcoides TaxID=153721 RepID=UPI00040593B5|nr:PAS domain-containing sensor histidine kinase [Sporocytophaga myxococcoides]